MGFRTLATVFLLVALAVPGWARGNGGLKDNSVWMSGGTTYTFDVSGDSGAGDTAVDVTVTTGGVTSPKVPGQEGSASTPTKPTCKNSDEVTAGGRRVRVKNNKGQIKGNDGIWRDMTPVKSKPGKGDTHLDAGELAPHAGRFISDDGLSEVDLVEQEPAPFAGTLGGGENVGSMPH